MCFIALEKERAEVNKSEENEHIDQSKTNNDMNPSNDNSFVEKTI